VLGPAEIAKLVAGGVKLNELTERIANAYSAVKNSDPAVKQKMFDYYGKTEADLAEYFLHPDKTTGKWLDMAKMETQVAAAQIGGYAQNVGLTGLSQRTAEEMADMVRGQKLGATTSTGPVTMKQVNDAELAASREVALTKNKVTGRVPGSKVNTEQLLAAEIGGVGGIAQTDAQRAVQRASQETLAPFQKGGGYSENTRGVIGAGSSKQ
jgi:hypothetical protein